LLPVAAAIGYLFSIAWPFFTLAIALPEVLGFGHCAKDCKGSVGIPFEDGAGQFMFQEKAYLYIILITIVFLISYLIENPFGT
jgi:hypothetical protein